MKIFKLLLILFLLTTLSASAQYAGSKFKEALIGKKAEIHYVFSDAPGFSVMKNGRMMGICVDIMSDFEFFLLDKYGIKVDVVYHNEFLYNFPLFLNTMEASSHGVFGLSNITKTLEREQKFKFSPPFMKNYAVLLTNERIGDLVQIDSISKSFKDVQAVSVAGSTNMEQLISIKERYYPNMTIDTVSNFREVLKLIDSDKDYFTIIDLPYWVEAIKDGLSVKQHTVGVQAAEELAVLLPIESDWSIPLRRFLTEEYKNSSSYRKIIVRYLGWETLTWLDQLALIDSMTKKSNK